MHHNHNNSRSEEELNNIIMAISMTATPFYQQLKEAHYDLDLWLSTRSLSKSISEEVQNQISSDLLAGLAYLSRKPGLWSILKNTLQANAEQNTP
jgi:hypothetical protein